LVYNKNDRFVLPSFDKQTSKDNGKLLLGKNVIIFFFKKPFNCLFFKNMEDIFKLQGDERTTVEWRHLVQRQREGNKVRPWGVFGR